MVYRTEIKIKPADLTDLTVTTDLSSWNLEQFTIDDNALIGGISATDNTTNITISSTGYITQTILFSDIPPTIYLTPANEVEKLSDGTNSYPIADKMARLMLDDKADINDIPTNNNQLTNGAGYITGISSSDVTTALGYTPANDSNVLKTTGNQTSTGEKGFQNITIGDTSEYKVDMHKTTNGDYVLVMFNQNNSAWLSRISIYKDGSIALIPSTSITAPTPATSDNSTKIATTAYVKAQGYSTTDTKNTAGSTDTSSKIFLIGATSQATNPQTYSHDTVFVNTSGQLVSSTPASSTNSTVVATTAFVKNQNYLTTTTKTVADSGCTFVISNGLKVITAEINGTGGSDYSWSYGTTFSNTPKVFVTRRSGDTASTEVNAWVRGSIGKSSCNIFIHASGSYTFQVVAIGN